MKNNSKTSIGLNANIIKLLSLSPSDADFPGGPGNPLVPRLPWGPGTPFGPFLPLLPLGPRGPGTGAGSIKIWKNEKWLMCLSAWFIETVLISMFLCTSVGILKENTILPSTQTTFDWLPLIVEFCRVKKIFFSFQKLSSCCKSTLASQASWVCYQIKSIRKEENHLTNFSIFILSRITVAIAHVSKPGLFTSANIPRNADKDRWDPWYQYIGLCGFQINNINGKEA